MHFESSLDSIKKQKYCTQIEGGSNKETGLGLKRIASKLMVLPSGLCFFKLPKIYIWEVIMVQAGAEIY